MMLVKADNNDYQITVEELNDGYIATLWEKKLEFNVDRKVKKFETFGGAMDSAFRWLAEINNMSVDDI
jgi:hypothetical protein